MNSLSRTLIFSSVTFVLGWAIGRVWQPTPIAPAIFAAAIPRSKPQTDLAEAPVKPVPVTNAIPLSQAVTSDRLRALSAALVWLRSNGFEYLEVPVFGYKGGIAPAFVGLFGLSSSEQKTLEAAFGEARRRSIEMQIKAAKVTEDPATDMLIVDIPTQPELGGQIYDDLLNTLRNVLGPDRYAYFNDFSGKPFERGLDSFGASKTKFEITREVSPDGKIGYSYKKYFNDPTGGNGWSGGRLDLDGLTQFFPEIAPLIPPGFKTKPAR